MFSILSITDQEQVCLNTEYFSSDAEKFALRLNSLAQKLKKSGVLVDHIFLDDEQTLLEVVQTFLDIEQILLNVEHTALEVEHSLFDVEQTCPDVEHTFLDAEQTPSLNVKRFP